MARGWSEVPVLRYLILAIAALMLAPLPSSAADLLIVQSSHSQVMDQMVRIVQNGCDTSHRTLVMSDYAVLDLARMVREEKPSVVVAIGDQAVVATKKISKVPVVYGMALNTDEDTLSGNFSGVSMIASPRSYLQLFAAMKLRRVGVIHERKNTGAYIRRAKTMATGMGIELVPLKVRSSKEVQQRLIELKKQRVEALWLLPDSTTIVPETVDSYFVFAQQNNLPVIGFSAAYLAKGALAAVELSRNEIGRQLCDKVKTSRMSGNSNGTTYSTVARLFFNSAVAEKLDIRIPPASALPPTLSMSD